MTELSYQKIALVLGESRYPALSTDGRWMAYSRLYDGMWNLWLRDQRTGLTRRIADVPCNQIQSAWEGDSKKFCRLEGFQNDQPQWRRGGSGEIYHSGKKLLISELHCRRRLRRAGKQQRLCCQIRLYRRLKRASDDPTTAEKGRFDTGGLTDLPHRWIDRNTADDIPQQSSVFIAAEVQRTHRAVIERAAVD